MTERPERGGSYVKKPDGTLERVAGTEGTTAPADALRRQMPEPPAPAARRRAKDAAEMKETDDG